jgi:hypothetical protein
MITADINDTAADAINQDLPQDGNQDGNQADDTQELLNQKKEIKSVQGEPDQVCENQEILALVQSRYIHILSNEYKGNASGKIGKAEAMICDCIYDKGIFFI